MELTSSYVIESRLQLYNALAEAAETEHNLMCLYLYAMFSLKREESEGVSALELEAIARWRKVILSIALEEMNHLTLVANLMTAIGVTPHFMRPNFPSLPGLYPANIVIELAKFDMNTLEHFIFLERPRSMELKDGESFEPQQQYTRMAQKGRLMPSAGDYKTVGALYESIRGAFDNLCSRFGEKELLCGSKAQQIGPLDSPLPGLSTITTKAEALAAIDVIITQGEGAADVEDSHFQRFLGIKKEYDQLLKQNPNFEPARTVARNPVMRKPINPEHRVWVTHEQSARYLDLANSLYGMMLRVLVQIYAVEERPKSAKATLLSVSYGLMHAMAVVGETLTYLPATDENQDVLAGMSFAMVRALTPLDRFTEKEILSERLTQIIQMMTGLREDLEQGKTQNSRVLACKNQIAKATEALAGLNHEIAAMPGFAKSRAPYTNAPEAELVRETATPSTVPPPSGADVEISETDQIELKFYAKKCIHSRHCVTELPNVFKANTPGKWIFAENTTPEILAAVARECPSGAIQYRRKDGGANEKTPDVNLMRTRENGPYAFLGALEIDGKGEGMRATLCRCGQSGNKPFCDGSHNAAKFTATGEPPTMDDTTLSVRNGKLTIERLDDGPLKVSGNLEICAGTGRVVLRTEGTRLCRCGQSKNKPICDNSHVAANFRDSR